MKIFCHQASLLAALFCISVPQISVGLPHLAPQAQPISAPSAVLGEVASCKQNAQCIKYALHRNVEDIGAPNPMMEQLLAIISGQRKLVQELACSSTNCSVPSQYLERLTTFGSHTPVLVVVEGVSPPPARKDDESWLILMNSTTSHTSAELQSKIYSVISSLGLRFGPIRTVIRVDVDARYFNPGHPSDEVLAIHFVAEGQLVVNPRIAAVLQQGWRADSDNLVSIFDRLSNVLSSSAVNASSEQDREAAALHVVETMLLSMTDLDPTSELSKIPWKCFWCIVALCYLLPVISNLAAQEVGTAYCSLRHLKPEDCVQIRYAIIALMVLVTPLEVFPIVKLCRVQEECHSQWME